MLADDGRTPVHVSYDNVSGTMGRDGAARFVRIATSWLPQGDAGMRVVLMEIMLLECWGWSGSCFVFVPWLQIK